MSEEIVDYALPLINIERMAKEIHQHALHGDFAAASESTLQLATEVRILQRVFELMGEKAK